MNSKILLLDFDSAGELGRALREIIESECNRGIKVVYDYAQTSLLAFRESGSPGAFVAANTDVVCAIVPQAPTAELIELMEVIKLQKPRTPITLVTEPREADDLLRLLQAGAADFITPPIRSFDAIPRILRLIEQARRLETTAEALREQIGLKQLVGRNETFLAELRKIAVIARCDASVLISGETGTGKELCARAAHYLSPRSDKPFLPINCGAIPAELMENELFGHERGAFTDASNSRLGLIHEAEGGTLFLDEVDTLLPLAQVKLLRFLQDKEYRALGSNRIRKADVRLITASNADLKQSVANGQLRTDFFYRLSTVHIELPPLRDRRDDIPLLVEALLARYAVQYNKRIDSISPGALQALLIYQWPGNVRELEHVIERAVVMSENPIVEERDISLPLMESEPRNQEFKHAKAKVVRQFEKSYIQAMLTAFHGNITRAAQAANKNRRAFWQLIRKHDIDVRRFKPRVS